MNDDFENRLTQISASIEEIRASSGKNRRELLDTLFRSVHSLKAAAQANGLNDLVARAHEFEDLLHAMRTGRASLDELKNFDHSEIEHLDTVIPADISGSLKDEERHRLAECLSENSNVYLVATRFGFADFDQQYQKLKENLNKIGEVIATAPRSEDGWINFRILFATKSELYRICHQAVQAGRAVAKDKQIDFSISINASLEKSICDALADPLMHLVRNAVDHGIESEGHVSIEATQTRIVVKDDGRGIDPWIVEKIFEPGFSTAPSVTTTSGRGVGLDVVKTAIETLGGSITVSSEPGKGSTFEILIPA
jgi:chemotaxis protein histidine kinase CheA